jgi:hypothetical protein
MHEDYQRFFTPAIGLGTNIDISFTVSGFFNTNVQRRHHGAR